MEKRTGVEREKRHHLYLENESAFNKDCGWADLVCEWVAEAEGFGWYAGWITLWFLGLSKCMVGRAKGTHISPTSDPRKLWVGVGFQMATQSYHCAPVNTMKTKLTHRWHSTPPTLSNLDFQTQLRWNTGTDNQAIHKSGKQHTQTHWLWCQDKCNGLSTGPNQYYLTYNKNA